MMFCHTIALVRRAARTAAASFPILSVIITTSAASMAASDPRPPIATPISALAKAGASFMPSPTNTTLPLEVLFPWAASTMATFWWGRSSACTSSILRAFAASSAALWLSPVSIIVLLTPSALRSLMAAAASSFISSDTTTLPINFPSSAAYTAVPASSTGWKAMPSLSISRVLPARTFLPSITASTPRPGVSV